MATRAGDARPVALRLAAIAQAAEAAGLAVAAVFAAIATADGHSYQQGSGVALTVIAFGTAAGLIPFAVGLDRARPWTRTPVVMIQLFVGGAGLYLLDGHRYGWGAPALLLALGCLVAVFTPASIRALNRPPLNDTPPESKPVQVQPAHDQRAQRQPAKRQPAKGQPAKGQAGKNQAAKGQAGKPQPAKNKAAR